MIWRNPFFFTFLHKNKRRQRSSSLNCFECAPNIPVIVTNRRGKPLCKWNKWMCAVFAPAVNVSAPLIECTSTAITVGQQDVGEGGERPTDLDSSHTSSTAGLLAKSEPLQTWLKFCSLLLSLNHLVLGDGKLFYNDDFQLSTWDCLIFLEIIAAVCQIPLTHLKRLFTHELEELCPTRELS